MPTNAASSKHNFTIGQQLTRVPYIPESVLKRHHAYCAIDTRFRSAARMLAALWLKEHNIATTVDERGGSAPYAGLGSILSPEAADAGHNFISPEVHRLALHEWLTCEEDAAIDDERLFSNSLSSMPLAFNLFGSLALDLELATATFKTLLPDIVDNVQKISFETSPGRRDPKFLADRTAFDVAAQIQTKDGGSATVFIELKLTEAMQGPAARIRDRYLEASRDSYLYRDPDSPILQSIAIEQLWREHLLAQLSVTNGTTPQAYFVAIGPKLNRRVQAAFRVYQAELKPADQKDRYRVPFIPLTLETVIEAIASCGAPALANTLWGRYCDFNRVLQLSKQELTPHSVKPIPNTPRPFLTARRRGVTRLRNEIGGVPSADAIARGNGDR